MKFKVGDKVKHKDFGVGEIIGFDDYDNKYAFEYWCWDDEIELRRKESKTVDNFRHKGWRAICLCW